MCQCESPLSQIPCMKSTSWRWMRPLWRITGSQQLVLFFYNDLQRHYFIVGWFCCFEGTVTGQWMYVFVDYCCVWQWTCWICQWLLVSYHKNNGKIIKWKNASWLFLCAIILFFIVTRGLYIYLWTVVELNTWLKRFINRRNISTIR